MSLAIAARLGTVTRSVAALERDGQPARVEVRLHAEAPQRTRLVLTHIAPLDEFWEKYGPGAAGVGWDLGLFGLARHLDDPETGFDETAFLATPEARELILGGSEAWGQADIAAGAGPARAQAAARRTAAFYTGTEAQGD